MSSDYALILPLADAVWDELNPIPSQTVKIDDNGTLIAYQHTTDGDPLLGWPVSTTVWAGWDNDQVSGDITLQVGETFDLNGDVIGSPDYPINPDYWVWVNLLGNQPDGHATGPLRVVRWAGHAERKGAETDISEYPDSNNPFTLTLVRDDHTYPAWDSVTTYDTGEQVIHAGTGWASQQTNNTDHEPGQPGSGPWWLAAEFGWGWTSTMIQPSTSQDPITNYNVRGYPTPECIPGDQIYTSGNFTDMGGGIFQTSIPSGNWTPTEEQVNIALIFAGGGNAQTGIITLEVGQDEATAEFWESSV
jgi:hypothetical protein